MAQDAASRYRGAYGSSAASAGPNTMNNFQFTQMGLNAGLATKNPYVAAIGTVGGFFGDLSLGRKRKLEADRNLMNSISQDAYNAQVAANPNPYTQDGGYEQAMSFSRGGTVRRFYKDGGPVGHVIPAERAGQAVVDAAKAGIDLQKPASRTGNQEGIIPGAGHPKADDKLMTPGGQSIRVSSGEVYVDDDTMRRMAEAVGVGIGSYAKMMYPDTKHGDGFADGGPVDPPKRIIQPPPENPVERVFLKSVGVKLTPRIGQRKKSIVSREKLDRMEPRSSQDGGARVPVSVPVPEPLPTDDSRYEPLRHSQAYGGSNITYPFDPIVAYSRKGERLPLEEKDYIFDTDEQKDWQTKKIKKYAQGGPVDPPREKTRTGISTERMQASDALAEQLEQERQARGRFRVEMPYYSNRYTVGDRAVDLGEIEHPRGHDGRVGEIRRTKIGISTGPPTDIRNHPGAFDSRGIYNERYRPGGAKKYADGGPIDPPKEVKPYRSKSQSDFKRRQDAYSDSLRLFSLGVDGRNLINGSLKGWNTVPGGAGRRIEEIRDAQQDLANKRKWQPVGVNEVIVLDATSRSGGYVDHTFDFQHPAQKILPPKPIPRESIERLETRTNHSESEERNPLPPSGSIAPKGRTSGFASPDALRFRVGPGNREVVGFADGGPLQLPPEGIPPNWAPSNPYGTGQYASAAYMDLVGQQLLSPERSFANFKEKREPVPERMNVRGMEASPLKPELKGVTKSASLPAAGNGAGRSDGTEAMRKTNNIAFGTNLALGTASLIYNAVQKGPVIPKPPAYEPEKVDLKTTALKAELDRRRVSGVATAGYALSNKQGLGRDLGLRSMDLSQRSQDALAVETVENQERSANTQIENQARLYNNQSLQRWMERDQEAQMNFRREKGDRMSMSLAGISDATSGWASGNQQIGAMGQMNDFNDRYLRYLSGNSETMQWDGSTIYFGDGTSTKRVERGVKLYDPQDYKYISNRFIR